jgi:AcrR family transcriptional regulator
VAIEAKPRLDRDSRREAILDVASAVFMEVGYAAASMSMIANRLGGSKGTLYNYFRCKEALFAAHVERECARQQEVMDELVVQAVDVRGGLSGLGRILLTLAVAGAGRRLFTLVAAEAGRAPAIGRAFYESGPLRGAAVVAQLIDRAVEAGQLRPCDPMAAAHQFIALCQNRLLKARLCQYGPEPSDADIDAEVASAVDTFMAAFGARTD